MPKSRSYPLPSSRSQVLRHCIYDPFLYKLHFSYERPVVCWTPFHEPVGCKSRCTQFVACPSQLFIYEIMWVLYRSTAPERHQISGLAASKPSQLSIYFGVHKPFSHVLLIKTWSCYSESARNTTQLASGDSFLLYSNPCYRWHRLLEIILVRQPPKWFYHATMLRCYVCSLYTPPS